MEVRPLQDRVLVERIEAEKKTAGGIIIPDTNTEKPSEGLIISVGPGRTLEDGSSRAVGVKKGDRVLFEGYGFKEVKVEGKEYLIMREDNLLGVLQ